MTTREEAKMLHPDADFWVGWLSIHIDNDLPISISINDFLRKIKNRRRVRLILSEDAVVACGIWTPEEAGDVASRLVFGASGEYVDPKTIGGFISVMVRKIKEKE